MGHAEIRTEDLLEIVHPYGMDFPIQLTWLVENTRKVSACFAGAKVTLNI